MTEAARMRKAQAFLRWLEADAKLGPTVRQYRRTRTALVTRWAAMLVLRSFGLSTTEVGKLLNRDHSTITYGEHRARRRPEIVLYADDLKDRFESHWLLQQPNHMTRLSGIV